MRKCHGYRLEHIFSESFYASQFFTLTKFIQKELNYKGKDKGKMVDSLNKSDSIPKRGRGRSYRS